MKVFNITRILLPVSILCFMSCNNEPKETSSETTTAAEPKLKEEIITYTGDNTIMNGYVVYDENIQGQRPAVIVVHEWWGLTDYPKMRARELAKLGYTAFALDMFGNGKIADNPDSAGKFAQPFYSDPEMAKRRFDAALEKLKSYPQTDPAKVAAIGYCFGGTQVLNMALLGDDLKGVVSFHGGLQTVPARKDLLKSAILVCHGGDDKFVPQADVDRFTKQLDSIQANYNLKVFAGATHAFTNPDATATGKKFNIPIAYNAEADTTSWNDMKVFLGGVFK